MVGLFNADPTEEAKAGPLLFVLWSLFLNFCIESPLMTSVDTFQVDS